MDIEFIIETQTFMRVKGGVSKARTTGLNQECTEQMEIMIDFLIKNQV